MIDGFEKSGAQALQSEHTIISRYCITATEPYLETFATSHGDSRIYLEKWSGDSVISKVVDDLNLATVPPPSAFSTIFGATSATIMHLTQSSRLYESAEGITFLMLRMQGLTFDQRKNLFPKSMEYRGVIFRISLFFR